MSANVADSYRSRGRQLAQRWMSLIAKQRGRWMIVWLIHCKEMDTWIKVRRVTSNHFQSQKPPLCKNANNRAALGHHCFVRRIKQRRSRELSLLRRYCAICVFKKKKRGRGRGVLKHTMQIKGSSKVLLSNGITQLRQEIITQGSVIKTFTLAAKS